uniref:G-protein coupled receptors family 2 profile 2 domain-containing protein n=2 Tax=Ciona intestinalis TaxID=7719 RepID=F6QGA2_CIOIN
MIYTAVKQLRNKKPTPYLVNLCISLLVGYTVFLFGIPMTDNRSVCHFITALMQFAFLSSWGWMTLYSIVVFKAIGRAFGKVLEANVKTTVAVYSLALLVVIVNACSTLLGVDAKLDQDDISFESSYRLGNMCWLRNYSLYFGFLVPVGIMLIINMFCFIAVVR